MIQKLCDALQLLRGEKAVATVMDHVEQSNGAQAPIARWRRKTRPHNQHAWSRRKPKAAAQVEAFANAINQSSNISAEIFADALTRVAETPRAPINDPLASDAIYDNAADHAPFKALSIPYWRALRAAPIRVEATEVQLAVVNPFDHAAIASAAFAFRRPIAPVISTPQEVETLLARLERRTARVATPKNTARATPDVENLKAWAEEGPVVRYVDDLIALAHAAGASDIHLEPEGEIAPGEASSASLVARVRVDGLLRIVDPPPADSALAVASRIKIMAGLDIAERRRPQDGRATTQIKTQRGAASLDLRVATAPALNGETLVLRLLRRSERPPSLNALGAAGDARRVIDAALKRAGGLTIVTGPTGAGKTTTLYAMLEQLRGPDRKIVSIEDPIEYQIEGVTQIQAKPAIGLDFAATLRATLRHDPDVVMIGETRDAETARIAVQAALTGHAVLTSLHTEDACAAVARLADMGAPPYLLAATLKTIIAQRLARRLCQNCREEITPPTVLAGQSLTVIADRLNRLPRAFTARGCPKCRGSGVEGRTGVFEAIEIDDRLVDLIGSGAAVSELRHAARAGRALSLFDAGVAQAFDGQISFEEVARILDATP